MVHAAAGGAADGRPGDRSAASRSTRQPRGRTAGACSGTAQRLRRSLAGGCAKTSAAESGQAMAALAGLSCAADAGARLLAPTSSTARASPGALASPDASLQADRDERPALPSRSSPQSESSASDASPAAAAAASPGARNSPHATWCESFTVSWTPPHPCWGSARTAVRGPGRRRVRGRQRPACEAQQEVQGAVMRLGRGQVGAAERRRRKARPQGGQRARLGPLVVVHQALRQPVHRRLPRL